MNPKRKKIWDKSNGHCWYCGVKLGESGWHVDHFEPVVRHLITGEHLYPERDTIDNKVPACASCNINKNSYPLESWRSMIENFIVSLNRDSTQYKLAKRFGLVEETGLKVKFWFEENKEVKVMNKENHIFDATTNEWKKVKPMYYDGEEWVDIKEAVKFYQTLKKLPVETIIEQLQSLLSNSESFITEDKEDCEIWIKDVEALGTIIGLLKGVVGNE